MQQSSKDGAGSAARRQGSTSVAESPVDDRTYNVMQALVSKLEAIEAYEMYAQDDGGEIFNDLLKDERRHAERLVEELRSCLNPR